jgi:hypothetical protein
MIKIIYDAMNMNSVPDGWCEAGVDVIIGLVPLHLDDELEMTFSTENIFSSVRLAVLRDRIDHRQVVFCYKNEILTLNKYGVPSRWPDGFLDHNARICEDLLRGGLKKRKCSKLPTS